MMESEFPTELGGLYKNLETKGNPWGQNAKERLTWIDEVDFDVPVYGKDVDSFAGFEYLFWVGCAGALDDRAKKTTKAVAELLAAVPGLRAGPLLGGTQVQRWRFARPEALRDEKFKELLGGPPAVLAGDAFAGARVPGAAASGWAAADLLLNRI
jgi:hypothetical protein